MSPRSSTTGSSESFSIDLDQLLVGGAVDVLPRPPGPAGAGAPRSRGGQSADAGRRRRGRRAAAAEAEGRSRARPGRRRSVYSSSTMKLASWVRISSSSSSSELVSTQLSVSSSWRFAQIEKTREEREQRRRRRSVPWTVFRVLPSLVGNRTRGEAQLRHPGRVIFLWQASRVTSPREAEGLGGEAGLVRAQPRSGPPPAGPRARRGGRLLHSRALRGRDPRGARLRAASRSGRGPCSSQGAG